MVRALRSRLSRRRSFVHQRQLAGLSDVLAASAGGVIDEATASEALDSGRFSLLRGASDVGSLIGALRDNGCAPERTFERAERILEGMLPAFGWTELDVGRPVDWNRDPVSGRRWPLAHWANVDFRGSEDLGDPRYVWEVNRHHHLVTLARARALGGERKYAEAAWREMRSWVDANPPYFGINWASALEVALRLIAWASVIDIIGKDGAAPGDVDSVLTSVALQARHLSANLSIYTSSKNNHLIGEAVGLLVAGTKFPFLSGARRWAEVGRDVAVREIAGQVTREGVSREQTFHYGVLVLEFAVLAQASLRAAGAGAGVDSSLSARISQMGEFISAAGGSSGVLPSVGDEDGGRAYELSEGGLDRQAIRAAVCASVATGRGLPDSAVGEDLGPAIWLYGPSDVSAGPAGDTSSREPKAFAEGGYFVVGRGKHHGVVDCGPLGYLSIAAHGHSDCLALCLSYEGSWFLVDPGTYCYHREPDWRDHFRGTPAHNTVAVDGRSQSEMLGPFMWGSRAHAFPECWASTEHFQYFEGRHDGYVRTRGVEHRRSVVFGEAGYWIVVDRLDGSGEHDVRVTYQFARDFRRAPGDGCTLESSDLAVDLASFLPGGLTGRVVGGEEDPPAGWVSEGFGHRAPAPAVVFEGACDLPATVVVGVVPRTRHGAVRIERVSEDARGTTELSVVHKEGRDRLLLGAGDVSNGERFEGRFGFGAERGSSQVLLGIDVARWSDVNGDVPYKPVRNFVEPV